MKIIDLSVLLNDDSPVYPGDPVTKIEEAAVRERDGYEDHYVSTNTHTGTHIDAPIHMVESGKTLGQFPIDKFTGRGVYIKVENRKFDLDAIKEVDINAGDIVLFHTGMSDVYYKPEYYDEYPGIPEEVANYLVEKKVSIVGVDMPSVDHAPYDTHKTLLKNEVLIIENLTNLSGLAGKDFEVFALPIKLDIDAAPARVIARYE